MTYPDAVTSCATESGLVFVPNDYDEWLTTTIDSYVSGVLAGYPVWVGCTDEVVQGTFQCVDGSQLPDVNSGKFQAISLYFYIVKRSESVILLMFFLYIFFL